MPASDCDHLRVLTTYPDDFCPVQVEAWRAGEGFSGARFWRVTTKWSPLCLRRWPPGSPSVEDLEFIHAVLRHVAGSGFRLIPVPYPNRQGETCVRYGDYLWELSPWLPGCPDFRETPSVERLRAAHVALAEFHQAAATYPRLAAPEGISPGLQQRRDQLRRWLRGELELLTIAVTLHPKSELQVLAQRILSLVPGLAHEVAARLDACAHRVVPLQPCIGDIWHGNVLFERARVTGLVDFGAMGIDTVARDIARLLGSMAGDDADLWQAGLEAYQAVRKLSESEQQLITVFDRSTVLMAGLNWLDWIYRQHRSFEHPEAIRDRLTEIADRLGHLRTRNVTGETRAPGCLGGRSDPGP
ncbi:MAG: phosphotransferase [Thermoguttaceae bacterium]